jgi:flagellar biosynthesis activator protein FlaF
MQLSQYEEIQGEGLAGARENERQAINRSIELLRKAKEAGIRSREAVEALHYLDRLWTLLLDDLAHVENRLPKELKASLISIGIWILREIEALRGERSRDFAGLIDISQIISNGLAGRHNAASS